MPQNQIAAEPKAAKPDGTDKPKAELPSPPSPDAASAIPVLNPLGPTDAAGLAGATAWSDVTRTMFDNANTLNSTFLAFLAQRWHANVDFWQASLREKPDPMRFAARHQEFLAASAEDYATGFKSLADAFGEAGRSAFGQAADTMEKVAPDKE